MHRLRIMLTCGAVCATLTCSGGPPSAPTGSPPSGRSAASPQPDVTQQAWFRVIVQLRVAESRSDQQRAAAIAQAREALFHELKSAPYRVTRTYDTIPFVGLELSPEALRIVERSTLTIAIEEDALGAPQGRKP